MTESPRPYPDPPWHTHGFGVMCPYLVRVSELELPSGLEPVSIAGRTLGMLGYIEYQAPSPLVYGELLWMPATVRFRAAGGRVLSGYWVARMYVDHDGSLAAGRELWALPKTKARFERRDGGVDVIAEDGSELSLDYRAIGPGARLHSRVATLQVRDAGVVGFRADFRGKARPARARVTRFLPSHPAWAGLASARRPLALASLLERFESTMQPPLMVAARA